MSETRKANAVALEPGEAAPLCAMLSLESEGMALAAAALKRDDDHAPLSEEDAVWPTSTLSLAPEEGAALGTELGTLGAALALECRCATRRCR